MSPEQASGNASVVDSRTDVYALGVMLYQMLTGIPPFQGDSFAALVVQHMQETPPSLRSVRAGIPVAWEGVVARAMEKDPVDRFGSMQEMAAAIEHAYAVPESAPAQPATRWTLAVPAIIVAAAAAAVALILSGDTDTPPVRQPKTALVMPDAGSPPTATPAPPSPPPDAAPPAAVPPDGAPPRQKQPPKPKPRAPKPDAPKPDAPKPDAPKPEPPKPDSSTQQPKGRGRLHVFSKPNSWAQVRINGRAAGQTPVKKQLPAGKHTVIATNPEIGEGKREKRTVTVKPGQTTVVRFNCEDALLVLVSRKRVPDSRVAARFSWKAPKRSRPFVCEYLATHQMGRAATLGRELN